MKLLAAVLTTFFVFAAPLHAQWVDYPTSGVPRTPAGTPDLNAPSPRSIDGHPDLSGIWDIEHNRPCPPDGCPDMRIGQEFLNIGWGVKSGLPYQPWAAKTVKERIENNGKEDPSTLCLATGFIKNHTSPLLSKIVQIPGLILVLSERNANYRQIFTDGRPLPSVDLPSFNGFSSGRWEGDTLVVQTIGFKDGLWLDHVGSPLTDAAKITERFRRVNYGKLEIEFTIDDPKAYTQPWTVKLNHSIVLDTELVDYNCLENEKDVQHLVGK
jgi:hypothetical protein